MSIFETLNNINVNGNTETKNGLTYLSWAWAWAEFKKKYPKATYTVDKFDGTYCTGNEKLGWMVRTEVYADELCYEMWLPIMDMRNNAILSPKMTDVNKTIMRCLTKNLAMFGLGLYIYAGEDLPEDEDEPQVKPIQNKPSTAVKSHDKAEVVKPLTRSVLLTEYGIENTEKTAVWLEGKFGKELRAFTAEETKQARAILDKKKAERDAEKRVQSNLSRIDDADLPFSMGG